MEYAGRLITVREYLDGAAKGRRVYIDTFTGREEVTAVFGGPDGGPLAHCGKSNGGFGYSYCVHYGTILVLGELLPPTLPPLKPVAINGRPV